MNSRPTKRWWPGGDTRAARRGRAGFTLVEALAALAFLAIVIPVAVQGLRVANLAGQVADRKAGAARVADRMLHELVATGQWQQSTGGGKVMEDTHEFRWQVRSSSWNKEAMKLLTITVTYGVQGQEYEVRASTLVDTTATQ